MKIHKFANVIALPFVLCLLYIAYVVYNDKESPILVYGLAPIMALVLIYLFSPQINYWWLSQNPVDLEKPIVEMLNKTNPIYSSLNLERKNEFDKRLLLFIEGKEFIGKGREEDSTNIPYDVKSLVSQIPITMSINQKDFTFKNFDRIVFYKHPFPSPRFQFLHTVETHKEDGVIILSLEHVQNALFNKDEHYDIAWHAFAEAFVKNNPALDYPEVNENIWQKIEIISPQSKEEVLKTLGFETVDPLPILINLYFNYEQKFRSILPDEAILFDKIFNNPT